MAGASAAGSILYSKEYGYFGQKYADDFREEITKQYDETGDLVGTTVYTYSNYYEDNGRLVNEVHASYGEAVYRCEYMY